ncbi:MAG: hypothetical protein WCO96_10110, partial [Actinomycetes bacterium]
MTLSGMRRFLPVALTAAACAIVIPACGSSDSSSSSTTSQTVSATKDDAIAAQVPAQFQGKPLVVGSDASYAPMEFIGDDGKTVVGADVVLASETDALLDTGGVLHAYAAADGAELWNYAAEYNAVSFGLRGIVPAQMTVNHNANVLLLAYGPKVVALDMAGAACVGGGAC